MQVQVLFPSHRIREDILSLLRIYEHLMLSIQMLASAQ